MHKQRQALNFFQAVAEQGYRILEAPDTDGDRKKFLAQERPPTEESKSQRYGNFLQTRPNLFLEFADLSPDDEEQILTFANRFGFLGYEFPLLKVSHVEEDIVYGELLSWWVAEITTMKQTVALWEMVRKKRNKQLAKVIRWYGQRVRYQEKPLPPEKEAALRSEVVFFEDDLKDEKRLAASVASLSWIDLPQYDPQFGGLPKVEPGDVIWPAWLRLQAVIERYLSLTSARILWEPGDEKPSKVRLGVFFEPKNLLGALWFQFAQSVAENKGFQRCQYCTRPFIARPNKRNCSDSCKSMMSRKGKKKKLSKKRKLKAA